LARLLQQYGLHDVRAPRSSLRSSQPEIQSMVWASSTVQRGWRRACIDPGNGGSVSCFRRDPLRCSHWKHRAQKGSPHVLHVRTAAVSPHSTHMPSSWPGGISFERQLRARGPFVPLASYTPGFSPWISEARGEHVVLGSVALVRDGFFLHFCKRPTASHTTQACSSFSGWR
jgi:hypothetical protein